MTTILDMGKKRTGKATASEPAPNDKAPKKRLGVNFTQEWHAVLRKLAGKRKMPVLWYLIELAREDAEKQGVGDLPPLPWEEESEGG